MYIRTPSLFAQALLLRVIVHYSVKNPRTQTRPFFVFHTTPPFLPLLHSTPASGRDVSLFEETNQTGHAKKKSTHGMCWDLGDVHKVRAAVEATCTGRIRLGPQDLNPICQRTCAVTPANDESDTLGACMSWVWFGGRGWSSKGYSIFCHQRDLICQNGSH